MMIIKSDNLDKVRAFKSSLTGISEEEVLDK